MKKVQGGTIYTSKEYFKGMKLSSHQKDFNKRSKEMHDYKVSLTKALNKKK